MVVKQNMKYNNYKYAETVYTDKSLLIRTVRSSLTSLTN